MRVVVTIVAVGVSVLCCFVSPARADVYYVDVAGGADFEAIGPAVQAAAEGDVIYVAEGTYDGEDNRDIELTGKNLTISGQGTVIIDCEGQGRAFWLHGPGVGSSTRIRFLRIINGAATDFGDGGGGIRCNNASVVIEYCTIRDCNAYVGGALALLYCDATVRYCTLNDNTAEYGGAVSTLSGSPELDMVQVWGNTATAGGGAVRVYGGTPRIYRVNAILNSSPPGTAAIKMDGTDPAPEITNCIVAFSPSGGAIAGGTTGTVQYCITYANVGGNDLPSYAAAENLICDPLFCDVYAYDLWVCEDSQALHTVNAWGQYIGNVDVGCYAPCQSPVDEESWGSIKALYR